jgi:hypothetical protein
MFRAELQIPLSGDYMVGASEKQINKEMLNRIEEVDKMKPEEKKMIYTFLDAFITKTGCIFQILYYQILLVI